MVFKYLVVNTDPKKKDLGFVMTHEEVQNAYSNNSVSVQEESDQKGQGLFQIEDHLKWFYSHDLWKAPDDLKKAIYDLLEFSLTGKK